jgi:hypothetical protein
VNRGLSVRDVARRTKLSIAVLQAIERNDFGSLPEGMYRKAYLRTVAAEVGLDANEIAADYRATFEPPIEPPAVASDAAREHELVEQLTALPERSVPALLTLSALAAAWFMFNPAGVTPDLPALDAVTPFGAERMPDGGAGLLPAASAVTPLFQERLSIEIEATGWCWVAAETDGERVIYRLIEPGERVRLEGRQTISLRLGDAGSVTASINGGPSRSFGGDGEVIELELTPDNVEDLKHSAADTASDG